MLIVPEYVNEKVPEAEFRSAYSALAALAQCLSDSNGEAVDVHVALVRHGDVYIGDDHVPRQLLGTYLLTVLNLAKGFRSHIPELGMRVLVLPVNEECKEAIEAETSNVECTWVEARGKP